jgi:hypothetical protein
MKLFALILALLALGLGNSRAGEVIWVGLYHAVNTPPPAGATEAPEKLHHRLKAIFGYKHYVLIKDQNIELAKHWQQWAVPRKDYFIRLDPLPPKPGEFQQVNYEIYKDGFIMVKGTYQPQKGTPLFLNGPSYNQGKLVFVLEEK